jgi:hypothetical protein
MAMAKGGFPQPWPSAGVHAGGKGFSVKYDSWHPKALWDMSVRLGKPMPMRHTRQRGVDAGSRSLKCGRGVEGGGNPCDAGLFARVGSPGKAALSRFWASGGQKPRFF